MTPEQAAYAKKNNFSDHLPRQRQVWEIDHDLTADQCMERLRTIADAGAHVFQVNGLGSEYAPFAIVWYHFED